MAAASFLFGGPGTPLTPDVTVDTYARMIPESLGGRLQVADRTAGFTQLEMWLNGNGYAALHSANTSVYQVAHGWEVVEVFVPSGDLDPGAPGQWAVNSARIVWKTAEDVTANEVEQTVSAL